MPCPGRAGVRRARRARRGRCRPTSRGSSYDGDLERLDDRALAVLERSPLGVVAGLVEEPGDEGARARRARPASGRPRRFFLRTLLARIAVRSSSSRSRGRTWLTTTPPTGSPCRRSSAMPSAVSCTGISSRTVTRWHAVCGDRNSRRDRVGLALDRPHLGQPGELVVDAEELGDPTGRRRVEHDGVVRRWRRLLRRVALRRLVDLAGQQHVAHAGGDGGRELDHAEPVERLPGPAELVVHRRGTPAAPTPGRCARAWTTPPRSPFGPTSPVAIRRSSYGSGLDVEHPGDALPALDLAQQHVRAGRGERQRQRCRHGRLAGAALAGHDVQSRCGEVVARHTVSVMVKPLRTSGRGPSSGATVVCGGKHDGLD